MLLISALSCAVDSGPHISTYSNASKKHANLAPLPVNNQETDSKKGTGMAIMNVIGQMGPLVGTSIFPEEDGPWYVKGMIVCAGFMFLVGVLAAVLRWVLIRENQKSRKGSSGGEYAGVPLEEGEMVKIQRKRFEYML
jgi:hypothetical protein